jgi:hypothetical protein
LSERQGRGTPTPALSIVLAAVEDSTGLDGSLGGLIERCAAAGAELVVVVAGGESQAHGAREQEGIRIVALEAAAGVAELRAAGMRACSGDVVALATDVADAVNWLDTWTGRHGGRRQHEPAGSPLTAAHAG